MQTKLREIAEKLDKMTIYEVRQIAREVRARTTSGQKGAIIEAILSYAKGETDAKPLSSRGAPPKSSKYDEKLVEDIRRLREYCLTEKSVGNVLSVAGEAETESEIAGILYLQSGDFYLYSENSRAQVSSSFISRYGLRPGDEVSGKAKTQGEACALISVEKVNGVSASSFERVNFSSLTPSYPERRIVLSKAGKNPSFALIDMFVPLAFGQRAVIVSPAHGGKTTLVKEIARGISKSVREASLIILQLCAKPEEITDFKHAFPDAGRFVTGLGSGREENIFILNLAFERAKRLAELKKDAVIIADGAYSACGAESVQKLLSCVCNTEEGGSVTAFFTVPPYGAEELISSANAVITISDELSSARIYPAVDVKKSYSYREEKLLSKDGLSAACALRAKYGAKEISEIISATPDTDILTEKYKNG